MKREEITSTGAPAAIGPYSQGLRIGPHVYVSGQIPLDPDTGAAPQGIAAQTARSLKNVRAVLEAAGCTMDSVVEATVFLKDMNDFKAMNEVYGTFFSKPFPARAAVEAARLPKDVLVEIKVTAVVPDA